MRSLQKLIKRWTDALEQGIVWGLFSGLYVLLTLVYTMARRVLPFFIERSVVYLFAPFSSLPPSLALYAFALGGIC
jgi:hypothetical protein